jgi:hypothetical protein
MYRLKVYGVLSHAIDEVLEFFPTEAEAQAVVIRWDVDEPDQEGSLEVVIVTVAVSQS